MDTFVIRIWMPADEPVLDRIEGMRGIVEHVSDGSLMMFDAPDQLFAFIQGTVKNRASSAT
jgi:hypothetical protein